MKQTSLHTAVNMSSSAKSMGERKTSTIMMKLLKIEKSLTAHLKGGAILIIRGCRCGPILCTGKKRKKKRRDKIYSNNELRPIHTALTDTDQRQITTRNSKSDSACVQPAKTSSDTLI